MSSPRLSHLLISALRLKMD